MSQTATGKQNKVWSAEDEWYLQENWGKYSIPAIAKHLGRTINAVNVRAKRLGLGAMLMGGDYITLNQLLIAVTGSKNSGSYKMKSWVENRGLPVHTKLVINNRFRVVYLEEFLAGVPTVNAVEVVRCKDCKHYKPQNQGAHRNCTTPYCMRVGAVKVKPDDFCSYGERKDHD